MLSHMKAISMDLRQRIVDAYDQGDTTRQKVAERFGVSLAFVKKLLSRRKRFGTIAPFLDWVGRKRAISPESQHALRKHLARHPGATLAELRDALGLACSLVTVFNTLRRMKLTYKKNASGSRTGPSGNPSPAEGLAREMRGMDGRTSRVRRRIRHDDQDGPPVRAGLARPARP